MFLRFLYYFCYTMNIGKHVRSIFDTQMSMRDKIIISVIYHAHAMPSDICKLQMSDVGLKSKTIKVKNRRYPVPGIVITALIEYSTANNSKHGPVFRNWRGQPLNSTYVAKIVSDAFMPQLKSTAQIISLLKHYEESPASPQIGRAHV